MRNFLNKLGKWLLVTLGVVVILLALGVGAFRVFVARAPRYQAELQAWVAGELGLFVSFDQLNARWGLRGPELTLDDVRIGRDDATAPLIAAESVGVGLDATALLLERELRVSRLTIEGLNLSLERSAAGRYQLADAPPGEGAGFDALIPEHVEVIVRGGQVRYHDAARGEEWRFDGVAMSLTRTAAALSIEARAAPAAALAERLELTLIAELGGGEPSGTRLRLSSDLEGVDVAALARLMPTETVYAVAGTGDAAFSIERAGGRIEHATVNLDLDDVVLPGEDAGGSTFDRVALAAEWSGDASGGWRLSLADVDLARRGRRWPLRVSSMLAIERRDGVVQSLTAQSNFVRLDDLEPIVRALGPAPIVAQWSELEARGDLRDLDFALTREAADWTYSLGVRFANLGFAPQAGRPGIRGFTGTVTTDARSGTLELASRDVTLDWPALFRQELDAESVSGSLVWRQGRDVVRVVSNDLTLGVLGTAVESSLELTLPLDGSSPHLDLKSKAGRVDLVAVKRFLPAPKMPRLVVNWLDTAVQGGMARNLELDFFGPVAAFPFDGGEGYFRVGADLENVALEFVPAWPRAEELDGRVEFVDAGFKASGHGRILENRVEDFSVEIPELRNPVLTVTAQTLGPLEDVIVFLQTAPLIATQLGPEYSRVHAHAGTGAVGLKLDMPLRDRGAFTLDAELEVAGGELSVDGFAPHATEINGVLEIDGAAVTAQRLEAIFLDGPVSASITVPEDPGYRAALAIGGEATAASIISAFGLPLAEQIGGQTRWQGRLLLPARATPPSPLRVAVQTNLTGVALKLPAPLAKEPGEPTNVQLDFVFPPEGGLAVDGNLGATRRLALRYARGLAGLEFDRGTVQLGGDPPLLPEGPGLVIRGTVPALDLGAWLALADAPSRDRTRSLLAAAELEIGEFGAFGQQLGATSLAAHRDTDFWNIEIASEAIAGYISIPRTTLGRPQIVANMERVYWALGDGAGSQELDPRTLPGIALQAAELAFDDHRLGRVSADLVPDAMGLRLASFSSATDSYAAEGSGSWLLGPGGPATRVAVNVTSIDVAAALGELGFTPFLAAETADVTASLYWPGGPDESWRDHVSGDVAIRFEKGSLPELDPGAGRVVGLLSIAALPRRLALDFRDVFSPGFVFDEISGDFTVIDGDAYTDNLKMAGPGAEIGVIGRTGLRDRDYQQQAVVTAEPGNMLPTVGALVAGPTVGAAWWLFMRIFREPLKGIGRASYCVTGTWDDPQVERLTADRLEEAEQCAALPPGGFSAAVEQN